MAILTSVPTVYNGATVAAVAAAGGGDKFVNTGNERIRINNGSGAPITVTIDAQSVSGIPLTDPTCVIPAGQARYLGPFDPKLFTDATGFLNLTYSGVTTLTLELFL